MNILQVSTYDVAGGAESSALNLFHGYRRQGHGSWLAVGKKFGADPQVFEIPNRAYQNIWAKFWLMISLPLEHGQRLRSIRRLRHLCRLLAEPRRFPGWWRGKEDFDFPGTRDLLKLPPARPDLVHCHNLHGGYFDLRALPVLSHEIPVILNLRDAWLLSGHCAHSFECERWKIGCGRCPDLTIYPSIRRDNTAENWQSKRDIYLASRLYLTAPSQWLMHKIQASMLRGVQHRVIPNAIDLSVFQPGSQSEARAALGLSPGAKIVLLTAHNEFKDLATMTSALERLQPVSKAELLFICLGKKGMLTQVGQGQMIFAGVERDLRRLLRYYQACDVYIHAARDEAFGKTVTEAMACGKPVVATAVGGIPEQIEEGHNGFLTPPRDGLAMAIAIQRLLTDPDLCDRTGQAGIESARQFYGLDTQIASFLNWYQEIIEDFQRDGKC